MNQKTLLNAIGMLDDEMLLQADAAPKAQRPIWTRIAIAAAVITLIVGSCYAATVIINRITEAKAKKGSVSAVIVDCETAPSAWIFAESTAEVTLRVDENESAPETIETYYAPTSMKTGWIPGEYIVNNESWSVGQLDTLLLWDNTQGQSVQFRQQVLHPQGEENIDLVSTGYDGNYRLETVTLDKLTLQCLTVDPSHTQSEDGVEASYAGMRKYYWSDGDYLFSLEVSYDLPESEISRVINSLEPTDDITAYMHIVYEQPNSTEENNP